MRNYELYARKYPAIVGMLLPILSTASLILDNIPQIQGAISNLLYKISVFVPVVGIYAAIGYFARQLFRDASKCLFQFPIFKEDETEMPTTQLLLWTSSKRMSSSMIEQVALKINNDFGIKLLSKKEERQDLLEAKRTIVDAVGKNRECTRTNQNLLQYNIDFGFCRNYLGATVYALVILLIILIINIVGWGYWLYTLIAFIIQLILGIIAFFTLKYKGNAYARALFNAYIGTKI